MKKRLLWGFSAICLLFALFAFPAWATEGGECGADMSWNYSDGTLTIAGSGAMDDFTDKAPWYAYKDEIIRVVLDGDITYIGANAFRDYDMLRDIDFGDALYEIGPSALRSCDGLTVLVLPATFKILGQDSLRACKNLTRIYSDGRPISFRLNSIWDTNATIYYPTAKPWGQDYIDELEAAFKGRIQFLPDDGQRPSHSDPITEPTTEPTTVPTTEPTTVPTTEPTTVPTTEPITVPTTEPSTVPTTTVQTEPPVTQPPQTQPPEPTVPSQSGGNRFGGSIIWLIIALISALCAILLGATRLITRRR